MRDDRDGWQSVRTVSSCIRSLNPIAACDPLAHPTQHQPIPQHQPAGSSPQDRAHTRLVTRPHRPVAAVLLQGGGLVLSTRTARCRGGGAVVTSSSLL